MRLGSDGLTQASNVVSRDHLLTIADLNGKVPRAQRRRESVHVIIHVLFIELGSGHTIAQHIELNWKRKIFEFRVFVLVAVDMSENKLLDNVVCLAHV
jgi:hypothetical protein